MSGFDTGDTVKIARAPSAWRGALWPVTGAALLILGCLLLALAFSSPP